MADAKLLDLPAATTTDGTEQYYAVQSGLDKRVVGTLIGQRRLTADTTFYVSPSGNDTTGTGTVGNPFLTPQKAFDYITSSVDGAGYAAIVQLAAGTTGSPNVYPAFIVSRRTTGQLRLETSDGDPTHTTIDQPSAFAFAVLLISLPSGFGIGGVRLNTNNGFGIRVYERTTLTLGTGTCPRLTFGSCNLACIELNDYSYINEDFNAIVVLDQTSYANFISLKNHSGGSIGGNATYTLTANPNWVVGFVQVGGFSSIFIPISSASAGPSTGKRFVVDTAGYLYSAVQLPGSIRGDIKNGYGIGAGGSSITGDPYATLGGIFYDSWATRLPDKGTISSGTVTFDAEIWSKYKLTVGGNLTIAFINWWTGSGTYSEVQIQLVNGGAFTITWPTINWMKGDGTSSTSFASMGVTLQSLGTNWILVWSPDGGTTLYGTAM